MNSTLQELDGCYRSFEHVCLFFHELCMMMLYNSCMHTQLAFMIQCNDRSRVLVVRVTSHSVLT